MAGLWEAGKKKWVKRLQAHRDGELDSNLAEAMDLCQEAARQARAAGEVHLQLKLGSELNQACTSTPQIYAYVYCYPHCACLDFAFHT